MPKIVSSPKDGERLLTLVADRKLRHHPAIVKSGGLAGVVGGLDLLRRGEVSGAKLTYKVV